MYKLTLNDLWFDFTSTHNMVLYTGKNCFIKDAKIKYKKYKDLGGKRSHGYYQDDYIKGF